MHDTLFDVNDTRDKTLETEKVCIKEEKRPLMKTCRSPVVVPVQQEIQSSCRHIGVQTETCITQVPAMLELPKETNQEASKETKFMFPFAAAAVVARVLRDELSENHSSNKSSHANISFLDSSKHNKQDTLYVIHTHAQSSLYCLFQ
jgi:hypothetical protein